jgi:Tat protein translocase TatB subunit
MLDFGFSEILLTSAIALVVLGPERLPKVARQVGNWMGRARVMARQLSEQLEREVSAEELLKEQSTPKPPAANRIAPPPAPYVAAPSAPNAPPQADVVAGDPHAAPHAEYEPPPTVTVPTAPPSND